MSSCSFAEKCCIYSNKDKNFKANHNAIRFCTFSGNVVSIVTKIRILKQITTNDMIFPANRKLYL